MFLGFLRSLLSKGFPWLKFKLFDVFELYSGFIFKLTFRVNPLSNLRFSKLSLLFPITFEETCEDLWLVLTFRLVILLVPLLTWISIILYYIS